MKHFPSLVQHAVQNMTYERLSRLQSEIENKKWEKEKEKRKTRKQRVFFLSEFYICLMTAEK
jgi:hypothetical protein